MVTENMAPGEGWLSDDSSFYGDEEEQNRLLGLCDDFIPQSFWSAHYKDINAVAGQSTLRGKEAPVQTEQTTLADTATAAAAACEPFSFSNLDRKTMEEERLARLGKWRRDSSQECKHGWSSENGAPEYELFNPREGCHDSWQLGESVDGFIKRLPPLTTPATAHEWIWVMNPYRNPREKSADPSIGDFRRRGSILLGDHMRKQSEIRAQSLRQPKAMMNRILREEGKVLQERITALAVECNVLSGKWMLFPKVEDVTRVWKLVVEGVIDRRLGDAAKVAPEDGMDERLICIYTKDFRDEQSVRRVLQELDSMGLLYPGRPIYYKSDAYTYLDIYKNTATELGLQASLYSSSKMMTHEGDSMTTSAASKRQSTLNMFY